MSEERIEELPQVFSEAWPLGAKGVWRRPARLVGKDQHGMLKVGIDWPFYQLLMEHDEFIFSSVEMWLLDHFLGRMEDMEKKFEESSKRLEALEAEKQELQEDVEVKHEVVVKSSEEIRWIKNTYHRLCSSPET